MNRYRQYTTWDEVPLVLTLPEAAVLLQETPESLKMKALKKQFPAYKQGKLWRVTKDALREYIRRNQVLPYPSPGISNSIIS